MEASSYICTSLKTALAVFHAGTRHDRAWEDLAAMGNPCTYVTEMNAGPHRCDMVVLLGALANTLL